MNKDCPFCNPSGEDTVIFNDLAYARWDIYPVSKGHMLISPFRHTASWFDTTDEEKKAIFDLVEKSKAILDQKSSPDGYNIGMNIGKTAGQTIFHLHVHLMPRYEGDVHDPTGGVRHVIPEKGNYKKTI